MIRYFFIYAHKFNKNVLTLIKTYKLNQSIKQSILLITHLLDRIQYDENYNE